MTDPDETPSSRLPVPSRSVAALAGVAATGVALAVTEVVSAITGEAGRRW